MDLFYYALEILKQKLLKDRTGMYDHDFDLPTELDDLRSFALLEQAMIRRGYADSYIAKVFSQNLFRVYRQAIG